jgi:hypothetical protein
MTTGRSADAGPEEVELREALEAGLTSARDEPLVEAVSVERALRRELDGLSERAERRKTRLRDGRGGAGGGWR